MEISSNRYDVAALLSRGILGSIPGFGPIIAEIVGTLIPNQRMDRLDGLLTCLAARVASLESAIVDRTFREPDYVDILEDGFHQAVRALSHERLDQIAAILAYGLTHADLSRAQLKRILALFGELSDPEIVILASHLRKNSIQFNREYFDKHEAVLMPRSLSMASSRAERDEAAVQSSFRMNLVRLGLLKPRFKKPSRGELPEFDDSTGMIKSTGQDLTALGRLMLRVVGIAEDDDI